MWPSISSAMSKNPIATLLAGTLNLFQQTLMTKQCTSCIFGKACFAIILFRLID